MTVSSTPDVEPTIAVVIPLYNHAAFIRATLQSVLDQTKPADEIILIDDGSADDGFKIAREMLGRLPNATVRTQKNAGAHETINRAIALAGSDYIAVLNSDDIFSRGKLARCHDLLQRDPNLDLIAGRVDLIDSDGHAVTTGVTVDWLWRSLEFLRATGNLRLSLLHENFITTTSNIVFKKRLWEELGKFQPLRYCHDLDFILHATCRSNVFFDEDVSHIQYRLHPTNTIKEDLEKIKIEIAAVLASALATQGFRFLDGVLEQGNVAGLLQALRSKQMSDLVLTFTVVAQATNTRQDFYEFIIANAAAIQRDADVPPQLAVGPEPTAVPSPPAALEGLVRSESRPIPLRQISIKAPLATIAVELSAFDKGGLEKVVLDSAIEMTKRGFRLIIIVVNNLGHLAELAARAGIEVIPLPTVSREPFYEGLLRGRRVNLAISHFSRIGYPIFARLGIPNITYIHNIYAMMNQASVENFKADDRFVDRYISVSSLASYYAEQRLDVDTRKIETIPNGLILEEHEARLAKSKPIDRSSLGIDPGDYVFLNVASYNLHKGHYVMAAAMERILRQRRDIKIVCVGNVIYPPHFGEFGRHLKEKNLDRHILMPGYQAEVGGFHQMSDAFLLPSFIEGWSIAMTEAMFYGKPMILTRTGGAPDVIEDSDIGLLVENEYGDVANLDSGLLDRLAYETRDFATAPALAQAMMEFADNSARWKNAGLAGHDKVVQLYNFDAMMSKTVQVMQDMVDGKRTQGASRAC